MSEHTISLLQLYEQYEADGLYWLDRLERSHIQPERVENFRRRWEALCQPINRALETLDLDDGSSRESLEAWHKIIQQQLQLMKRACPEHEPDARPHSEQTIRQTENPCDLG